MQAYRKLQVILIAVVLILATAESALALSVIPSEHDWTVSIGDSEWGLTGYWEETWVSLGPWAFSVPFRAPTVAVGGGLLMLAVATACVWCLSRWNQSPLSEDGDAVVSEQT